MQKRVFLSEKCKKKGVFKGKWNKTLHVDENFFITIFHMKKLLVLSFTATNMY